MILNKPQAQAAYAEIVRQTKKVSDRAACNIGQFYVSEMPSGAVYISQDNATVERHENQSAFAVAYGLTD